jgi:hypothetical protein
VVDEVESFLKCGILAHGFIRVACDSCRESRLVAFSCKRRGFCPSCLGRRMADFAAHLRDHVMPHVPVRQWVLTVPFGLRFGMAFDPALAGVVLRTFVGVVSRWLAAAREALLADVKATLAALLGTASDEIASLADLVAAVSTSACPRCSVRADRRRSPASRGRADAPQKKV